MGYVPDPQALSRLRHDVRDSLNAIQLAVARGRAGECADRVRDVLDVIDRQVLRLSRRLAGEAEQEHAASLVRLATGERRILLVENDAAAARSLSAVLDGAAPGEFALEHVACWGDAEAALERGAYDGIVLDLFLPDSSGGETLERTLAVAPEIPVVVVTSLAERETALEAVRGGAQDFLVKGEVDGPLLARALHYAIERKKLASDRDRLIAELTEALATVKQLRGMLPICAWCKRIRDEGGAWHGLEDYLRARSEVNFSHGLCPSCADRVLHEDG